MAKDIIEVRLNGTAVGIGNLRAHLAVKAQTYRLLRHWGLNLDEIRYLTSRASDDILAPSSPPPPHGAARRRREPLQVPRRAA